MSDRLRYRVIDEPRPNALSRFALPPLLAFMVATFFQPWGYLLLAANALALNSRRRNVEIAWSLAPIPLYFATLIALDTVVRGGLLRVGQAQYVFVVAVAAGLASAAFAYVSQAQTFELRRFLGQSHGFGR